MLPAVLRQYLDDAYAAGVWLCGLGIVDVHRAHMMQKLDLHNIAEISAYAVRHNLLVR